MMNRQFKKGIEMLVNLRKPKFNHDRDERFTQLNYSESEPFFNNPRGVLSHRVRAVFKLDCTHYKMPRLIFEYWCESSGSAHDETDLVSDPGHRLVCVRCEANAIAKGEKTSSDLVGHHICTGVCRPVNTCCGGNAKGN